MCQRRLQILVEEKGGVVKERIAKASRAFGMLKEPIFKNSNLSYKTKRLVYKAVDHFVWVRNLDHKAFSCEELEVFHNRCMRTIMGISSVQQRLEHISTIQVAKRFGMEESLEDIIAARRLRWLGCKNG